MHGENDSSVFSSLALAFHQTGIPDLLLTANCLQHNSHRLSGGTNLKLPESSNGNCG
jgi:Mrp family chromosome partitioning ATPase